MGSYEGRRSFLLGMTLNELAFMMFFLLMLLSIATLHRKTEQLAQESQKNSELRQELSQAQQNLDQSFKRLALLESVVGRIGGLGPNASRELLDQAFQKLQTADPIDQLVGENSRLKAELQQIQTLQKQLQQIDPEAAPSQTLKVLLEKSRTARQQRQNLQGQLQYLQRRLKGNGLDHPPCWAASDGAIQYLYRITIHRRRLTIERAWPDSRNDDIRSIPGASALPGQSLTLDAFSHNTATIYRWSLTHACRHFVRIRDEPQTSKDDFKKALLAIESVFYKYLEQ